MTRKRFVSLPVLLAATVAVPPAFAEGSPWLPAPGAGTISVSYVSQEATEFYRAAVKGPTPAGGHELGQETLWVNGTYGISDALALDFRVGAAESSFMAGPSAPFPPKENLSGLQDVNAGLVWRFRDEVVSSGPSLALRAAAIVGGSYTTGYISSLGDGGDGGEASLLLGKYLGERGAFSAELGYRHRGENIPADTFLNLSAGVLVGDRVGLNLGYRMTDAESSGLDIGVPPFSPSRFPELQEDIELVTGTVSIALRSGETPRAIAVDSLAFTYGSVVGGRNTAVSDVFSVSIGFNFDTY